MVGCILLRSVFNGALPSPLFSSPRLHTDVMESESRPEEPPLEKVKICEGEAPLESPRLPRPRLGSIVKIKPRKSYPDDSGSQKGKDLETISHISEYIIFSVCRQENYGSDK